MPRSNRPRGAQSGGADDDENALERAFSGRLRVEERRDGRWNVQPVARTSAAKSYLCPGCHLEIAPGVAHLVAWRADGLMGEADDLASRRHWHTHCWRIR